MLIRKHPPSAQTSKQVKAEYKKYGPRMTSQEARRLERAVELDRRAEKIRETERHRKEAKKRKLEKEERDREIRREMGISEPLPRVRASQSRLMSFMKPAGAKPSQTTEVDFKDDKTDGVERDDAISEQEEDREPFLHDAQHDVADGNLGETGLVEVVKETSTIAPLSPTMSRRCHQDLIEDYNFFDICFNLGTQTQRELVEACDEDDGDNTIRAAKAPDLDGVMFDIDDLTTDTQIERELAIEQGEMRELDVKSLCMSKSSPSLASKDTFLDNISTQDVQLTLEELEEMGVVV